ncbi:hypothetical protein Agabi119p4_5360 [Agaricus bisporus var. burnettii]|uniref:C2H2-type domain-containing protein n=1 Tax=Agaricus bisporus var. burnettii TaxID=192524 RepID=A0A8H7F1J6_AGABI|nr:hypothetical protein Agabi119p4_5360 [Agaricus bisporus var. burnettii]
MTSEEVAKINELEPEIIDLTILSSDSSASEDGGDDDDPTNGTTSLYENTSDTSEVEIQLNQDTRLQLKNVINTISAVRLRQLLIDLVDTEQAVEIALTRELITLNRETHKIVPRWETCQNCGEDYDTNTKRELDECEYHPGELEVDEDGFADHDEDVHGPMDTEENRAAFPENFIWTCCDATGNGQGCVQGDHQPSTGSRKRRRL